MQESATRSGDSRTGAGVIAQGERMREREHLTGGMEAWWCRSHEENDDGGVVYSRESGIVCTRRSRKNHLATGSIDSNRLSRLRSIVECNRITVRIFSAAGLPNAWPVM